MTGIHEFYVVEPPTTAEVRQRLLDALRARSAVALRVATAAETPAEQGVLVEVGVRHATFDSDAELQTASGIVNNIGTVALRMAAQAEQPATASVVFAEAEPDGPAAAAAELQGHKLYSPEA